MIEDKLVTLDYKNLYADQKSALTEIEKFLESPEQQVFILHGTANSGKSYLIPFIQKLAQDSGIQETEIFASSARVANNLLSISSLERVNSIYSYIYGGQKESSEESEQQEKLEELEIEEIPLKSCDNSKNALFIVDESQLVSDSFNQSIDLIFGTGYLLKDFINFCDLTKNKRKIIFIGDSFQIQLGKNDELPLNPSYLKEAYKLNTNSYELLDKPDFSNINKQAMLCVENIRLRYFNFLSFNESDNFYFLNKEDSLKLVSNIIYNKIDCHILCFTNEKSQAFNKRIKEVIIKNGEDIAINDLVIFNNNISIENSDSPFAEPKKIYNGQFATVIAVYSTIDKPIFNKKGELVATLKFREIALLVNDTGQELTVLSFENYRLSPKSELSKDEIIAFKILLNSSISEFLKLNPFENTIEYSEILNSEKYRFLDSEIEILKQKLDKGEKVKTKLDEKVREQKKLFKSARKKYRFNIKNSPATDYYKFKNAAFLKFGWAMTIDKSSSYKWQEVIIDTTPGSRFSNSKTHEPYFRMIYTGITRAKEKVYLMNYEPITPFDNTQIIDSNFGNKIISSIFVSNNPNQESRLLELREFIANKIKNSQSIIEKIENLLWQERYHLTNGNQKSIISFSYNKKGEFKLPKLTDGDVNYGNSIIEIIRQNTVEFDFSIIKDAWRKFQYQRLSRILDNDKIKFDFIIQTDCKDKIRLYESERELQIEVDYKKSEGIFSNITAKYYNNPTIWDNFKNAIQQLKD